MRAVILSDSHGDDSGLRYVLEQVWKQSGPVDAYFHLGDGARDFERAEGFIRGHDPRAQVICVKGNCDFGDPDTPLVVETRLGGANVLLTHGHAFHVKQTLAYLDDAARDRGCTIALYGHTHVPNFEMRSALLLNPGSVQDYRAALLDVDDQGRAKPRLLSF